MICAPFAKDVKVNSFIPGSPLILKFKYFLYFKITPCTQLSIPLNIYRPVGRYYGNKST